MHIAGAKARRAAFHQEAANALIGFSPDDGDIGNAAVGNPHFGAVQNVRIAIEPRRRAHTAGGAARIRLGQSEAANRLASRDARQPALLLLLRAILVNWEHGQRTLHRHERAQTAIARLQLLAGQPITDRAQPGAAIPLEMHTEQTQLGNFRDKFAWKRAGLKMIPNYGQDALIDKLAHGIAHHTLLFAEQVIDIIQVGGRWHLYLVRCFRTGHSYCLPFVMVHRCTANYQIYKSWLSELDVSDVSDVSVVSVVSAQAGVRP